MSDLELEGIETNQWEEENGTSYIQNRHILIFSVIVLFIAVCSGIYFSSLPLTRASQIRSCLVFLIEAVILLIVRHYFVSPSLLFSFLYVLSIYFIILSATDLTIILSFN